MVAIEPMEALLVDELPTDAGWCFEPKWDGFRCVAEKQGGKVQLHAKSGKPLHRYFPEIVGALEAINADDFILDGELCIHVEGAVSFELLQLRLHPAESRIRKLSHETPAVLILFDLLVNSGGKPVADQPLGDRQRMLHSFFETAHSASLRLSPTTQSMTEAREWLARSGGAVDGVIAKRLSDAYRPGERAMLKVKNIRTADCVVGGFRYATGSKIIGSLLLGLYDKDGLLNHVGYTSALARKDKAALTSTLEARKGEGFTGDAPGGPSRWSTERSSEYVPLRHELVVEVSYDHISGGRFRHGTALRRWRPDKAPRQCTDDQMRPPGQPPAAIRDALRAPPDAAT